MSSAASQAVSGSGPVVFNADTPPWLIGALAIGGLAVIGLLAWLFTRK